MSKGCGLRDAKDEVRGPNEGDRILLVQRGMRCGIKIQTKSPYTVLYSA
jgi:hypothetical protein